MRISWNDSIEFGVGISNNIHKNTTKFMPLLQRQSGLATVDDLPRISDYIT